MIAIRIGLLALAILTLAVPMAGADPDTCYFSGTPHGQCTTQGGRDCFTFRFVVSGTDCQVDLYRTKTTGSSGWELIAQDIQDEYSDCPDWSKGPYDYKLFVHCGTCQSGQEAFITNISCP